MKMIKMPVYVWTVNKSTRMKKFLKLGVDGIITDKPDEGLYVRKEFYSKKRKHRYEEKNN